MTVDREALATALKLTKGAVSSKPVLPVLRYARIDADPKAGAATCTTTNIDITTSVRLENAAERSGTAIAEHSRLSAFVSSADGDKVEMELEDGWLKLRCGTMKAKLATMKKELWPKEAPMDKAKTASVEGAKLYRAISTVKHAALPTAHAAMSENILLEMDAEGLTAVATDGKTLATWRSDAGRGLKDKAPGVTLGKQAWSVLETLTENAAHSVKIEYTAYESVRVTGPGGRWTLRAKVPPVQYPEWRKILLAATNDDYKTYTLDRQGMVRALRGMVSLLPQTADWTTVKMTLSEKGARFSGTGEGVDATVATDESAEGAEGIVNTLDAKRLLRTLEAVADDKVKLGVTDSMSPVTFETPQTYGMMMPLRCA